jgi:FixJ family two-component response regulator
MSIHPSAGRAKLSTTVSAATMDFLEKKVVSGEAATLAEAVDAAIEKARQLENRQRLAAATAQYFAQLDRRAAHEENALGHDLAAASSAINFDEEL